MRVTFFTFLIIICSIGYAQSVPKLIRIADELYEAARYLEAIEFYDKIAGIDKRNYQARFRLGFCYYRTLKYDEAKEVFLSLGQVSEGNDHQANALYHYGNLLKLESQFEVADSIYANLITLPSANPDLINSARKQKEGCLLALRQEQVDKGYSISPIDEINSRFHDFGAVVNPSNDHLVFASTRNLPGEQYEGSQFDGVLPDLAAYERNRSGRWRIASNDQRFSKLNTHWSEGSGSFTKDGNTFYFSTCRGESGSDCSIMVTYLIDDTWTDPVALNEYINEPGAENKQPSISFTGDTLFFSSDRPGGLGGSDIWMSLKGLEAESWSPAINMGDVINSPENDITPYFSSAYNTLLFASNGHVGYGGYDIYAAKGESFFEPEVYNLGHPFNSTLDDTYFNISDSVGFISSNREDHKNLNLYSFAVSNERLFLSLLISGESLIDSRLASRFRDIRSLDLVTFRVEDYQGYELFDPVKRKKPKPKILEESVAPTDSLDSAALSLVAANRYRINYETEYFGYGHFMLRPESKRSMDNLVAQLKDKEYTSVTILAYTDHLGTDSFNIDLSKNRGKSVMAYLALRGIPLDKIKVFARGELKPDSDMDHIFRRIFSRKVEIIVEADGPIELRSAGTYIVAQEDTPEGLAEKLGVSVEDLIEWNDIREERVPVGSTIRLYDATPETYEGILVDEDMSRQMSLRRVGG